MKISILILFFILSCILVPASVFAGADDVLLVHWDEADGNTSPADSSPSAHTLNNNGDAQTDDAVTKWDNTSVHDVGTDDYWDIDDSSDFDFIGSAVTNRTIDCWYQLATTGNGISGKIISQDEYVSGLSDFWALVYYSDSGDQGWLFWAYSGGGSIINSGYGGGTNDTNWHHVALCKVASKYGVYVDGTQVNYTDDSSTDTFAGSVLIGANWVGAYYGFYGWLDELRYNNTNVFGAAPNDTPNNTITVPTGPHNGVVGQFIFITRKDGKGYDKIYL